MKFKIMSMAEQLVTEGEKETKILGVSMKRLKDEGASGEVRLAGDPHGAFPGWAVGKIVNVNFEVQP